MAETIMVDHLKYEVAYDSMYQCRCAELVDYDRRKKDYSYIRLPKTITYNSEIFPVLKVNRFAFAGLNGVIQRVDLPTTLKEFYGQRMDLSNKAGYTEYVDGVKIVVYEAEKKSWLQKLFGK